MFDPESQAQPTNGIMFYVPYPIQSLDELRAYVVEHGTSLPITAAELLNARIVSSLDDLSEPPEEQEFTQAEAVYLAAVIDYCLGNPEESRGLIEFEPDDDGGVDVEIIYPELLEPPAELRL